MSADAEMFLVETGGRTQLEETCTQRIKPTKRASLNLQRPVDLWPR